MNGANIKITNIITGQVLDLSYNSDGSQFVIDNGQNFKIEFSRLGILMPPLEYNGIAGIGTSSELTFNYYTAGSGCYIYTKNEQLIAPADFTGTVNDVIGVYVGNSTYRCVFAPVVYDGGGITYSAANATSSPDPDWGTNLSKSDGNYKGGESDYEMYGNNEILATNFPDSGYAKAKAYKFSNGQQSYIPPLGYVKLLSSIYSDFITAYSKLSVSLKTSDYIASSAIYYVKSYNNNLFRYEVSIKTITWSKGSTLNTSTTAPTKSIPFYVFQ